MARVAAGAAPRQAHQYRTAGPLSWRPRGRFPQFGVPPAKAMRWWRLDGYETTEKEPESEEEDHDEGEPEEDDEEGERMDVEED